MNMWPAGFAALVFLLLAIVGGFVTARHMDSTADTRTTRITLGGHG
jgi:hypothetical protein